MPSHGEVPSRARASIEKTLGSLLKSQQRTPDGAAGGKGGATGLAAAFGLAAGFEVAFDLVAFGLAAGFEVAFALVAFDLAAFEVIFGLAAFAVVFGSAGLRGLAAGMADASLVAGRLATGAACASVAGPRS
jgi:hypothetical protein